MVLATENMEERAVDALRAARHVVVLTGSGVSAESGIPTFRDAHSGLWSQYRPEDLATPEAFERDPALVWRWYAWRRSVVAQVEPNAGHYAIAKLAGLVPRLTLITQNVDGLHAKAGSKDSIEFHGNIARTICSAERTVVDSWEENDNIPPSCPVCGASLRPDVVWFGEQIPQDVRVRAFEAAADADVLITAGTSAVVHPAATLIEVASRNRAQVIEINIDDTPVSELASSVFRAPSGQVLPALVGSLARSMQ